MKPKTRHLTRQVQATLGAFKYCTITSRIESFPYLSPYCLWCWRGGAFSTFLARFMRGGLATRVRGPCGMRSSLNRGMFCHAAGPVACSHAA